jgi:KTSC domain
MIRSRLYNPVIKAVSYEAETKTLVVELTTGSVVKHSPVPYETYLLLVNSRFPEKVYRHQVMLVIPEITG